MSDDSSNDELESLVVASRSGDQQAWALLVDRLSPLVWNVTRSFGLDSHDAVDVSQTTWLQFARHVNSIAEPRKAPGWLATTARRECIRFVRVQQREKVTPSEHFAQLDSSDRPELEIEITAEHRMIREAVDGLHENCRTLVRMFLADPAPSYEAVAVALDISVNAVGPKRSRCLAHLRTVLNEKFAGPEATEVVR